MIELIVVITGASSGTGARRFDARNSRPGRGLSLRVAQPDAPLVAQPATAA